MKILIITDANIVWAREYIERVLLGGSKKHEIYVLALNNDSFKDFYAEHNIPVYVYSSEHRIFINRWVYRAKLINRIKEEIEQFDVIQVNLVTLPALNQLKKLWSLAPKHILTFWGSDMLRANDKAFAIYQKYFDKVDSINLLTNNMYQKLIEKCGHKYDDKVTVFDFGCPMYESIDEIRESMSKEDCKRYWGIDSTDYVVPIGYNSIPEQQHIKIIDAIKDLDDRYKKSITFVLHFCYGIGDSQQYQNEVIVSLESNGFKYIVIDKYLDKKETAILRLAADIFLYGQTTDALSASVIEYLYSGCILVKPDWLNYPELDSRYVKYIPYNDFNELLDAFGQAISVLENHDALTEYQNNRDILWNMNSWEVVALKWRALYED